MVTVWFLIVKFVYTETVLFSHRAAGARTELVHLQVLMYTLTSC